MFPLTLLLSIFIQKQTLFPQLLKHLSWCPNPLHLLSFLPFLCHHFQTCISITNSQTWGFYHRTSHIGVSSSCTCNCGNFLVLKWLQICLLNPQKKNLMSFPHVPFFPLFFDFLAHFTNQNSSCRLCHREKESRSHLLEECSVAEGLLQAMGRKCILLNVPSWQETKNVCGLVSNFLTRQETSVVSVALLCLWLTVCAEGSKSP